MNENPYNPPETEGARQRLSPKAMDRLAPFGSVLWIVVVILPAAAFFGEMGWLENRVGPPVLGILAIPSFVIILRSIKMPFRRR